MATPRAADLLLALGHNCAGLGIIVLSHRPDGGSIDILGVDPSRSARTGQGQEHVRTVLEQTTDLRDRGEGASGLFPRAHVLGLEMVQEPEGDTVLTVPVIDRMALHGILS
jgi:hypothetical protein